MTIARWGLKVKARGQGEGLGLGLARLVKQSVWPRSSIDGSFTAQRYASAVYATELCLCVFLCLSQVGVLLKRIKRTKLARRLYPSTYTLFCKEIRVGNYLQNKGSSLWNFVPNSGLRKYRRQVYLVVNKTRRRSSSWITATTVDASWLTHIVYYTSIRSVGRYAFACGMVR